MNVEFLRQAANLSRGDRVAVSPEVGARLVRGGLARLVSDRTPAAAVTPVRLRKEALGFPRGAAFVGADLASRLVREGVATRCLDELPIEAEMPRAFVRWPKAKSATVAVRLLRSIEDLPAGEVLRLPAVEAWRLGSRRRRTD